MCGGKQVLVLVNFFVSGQVPAVIVWTALDSPALDIKAKLTDQDMLTQQNGLIFVVNT